VSAIKNISGFLSLLRTRLGQRGKDRPQPRMANDIGVSPRQYQRWEKGYGFPSNNYLFSIIKLVPDDETLMEIPSEIPDSFFKMASKEDGVFPRAIKALRDSLGITQEEASRRAGVTLNVWKVWEYGIRKPTVESIDKIALAALDDRRKRKKFYIDIFTFEEETHPISCTRGRRVDAQEKEDIERVNAIIDSAKKLAEEAADSTEARKLLKKFSEELKEAEAVLRNGKKRK